MYRCNATERYKEVGLNCNIHFTVSVKTNFQCMKCKQNNVIKFQVLGQNNNKLLPRFKS